MIKKDTKVVLTDLDLATLEAQKPMISRNYEQNLGDSTSHCTCLSSRFPQCTDKLDAICSDYGGPPYHAIFIALRSRIASSVRTRTVSSALYALCVQAGNTIGITVYRSKDSPWYAPRNAALIAVASYNIVLLILQRSPT